MNLKFTMISLWWFKLVRSGAASPSQAGSGHGPNIGGIDT